MMALPSANGEGSQPAVRAIDPDARPMCGGDPVITLLGEGNLRGCG